MQKKIFKKILEESRVPVFVVSCDNYPLSPIPK